MAKPKIGFVGLGAMGAPMAKRLLEAGYTVTSRVNRNREPLEALLPLGIHEVSTAKDIGAVSDILMLVVWDEAQIDAVLKGADGALASLKPGSKVLLMSTVSPDYCRALAAEVADAGIAVLDCPLSGMPQGSAAGTLSLMIGGAVDDIEACRAPLEELGTIYRCGDTGAGQVVKLGNNAMVIATMGLLLEIRETVRAQGVDFEHFLSVLNNSTGRSFVSENMPLPPTPTAPHAMAQKDVGLMLAEGRRAGEQMPMLAACYRHTLEGAE